MFTNIIIIVYVCKIHISLLDTWQFNTIRSM